ncbi:unnamed protein product [Adineta steineri]|uniref:G-protein coupled receptors family 1 profile domain-containing protein n=1 Tax=Adineta steineri TaxID=433720 RepID=A0A813S140_9BILA|nr:unnamed protein product [Adineta steineri]CAF0792550.1 unnamed protein product [Adineta steineri]CAF0796723.1 unnamed protein product [Adineta steineri]
MDISSNVTIDDLVIDNVALYESIRRSFSRDPFDHYINGLCGLFICLLGTISNALSFSILIRRTMRLSTYVYLAGLCLSDFTACLFLIPGYILDAYPVEVPDFELPRTYTYTKLLIIAGAISTTARALSVWLCVAFTIDRWIMICRPFVGPLYCTIKNARRVSVILYIVAVFYAGPLMFEYQIHQDRSLIGLQLVDHNKEIYRYKLSKLGSNSIFRWTYVLINAMAVYVIPITIIVILNRKLLTSIRLLEQRSAEFNAPLPTKQGVTIMLLATTVTLLVFRSPSAIISVMWLISAKMFINEKPPFPLRKFHSIANLCATINAATTFIMFIVYGTKFRSEFTRNYCCMFTKMTQKKSTTLIRHEQQQLKLISNNKTNENDQQNNDIKNISHLAVSSNNNNKGKFYKRLSKRNSSNATSTGTTSIGSLSPKKELRKHRLPSDPEYNLMMNSLNNNRQHEIAIPEDECNGDQTNSKSVLLTESYFDWFKNLLGCR